MNSSKYLMVPALAFLLTACNSSGGSDSSNSDNIISEPKTVVLYWNAPTEREDGETLESAELGGFVVRYRKSASDAGYTSVLLGTDVHQHTIDLPDSDEYEIQVAAFDTDGVYSSFVTATSQ